MASNVTTTNCASGMTAMDNNNHVSISIGNASSISEFFSNKNVFITGATGFVGQALIEKILRSCPEVNICFIIHRYLSVSYYNHGGYFYLPEKQFNCYFN